MLVAEDSQCLQRLLTQLQKQALRGYLIQSTSVPARRQKGMWPNPSSKRLMDPQRSHSQRGRRSGDTPEEGGTAEVRRCVETVMRLGRAQWHHRIWGREGTNGGVTVRRASGHGLFSS